ncbi:hypothetical protein D9613_004122 [Agrocybe pediades]|uniref:WLM domain-containing protein n=1 Tax=Agrocybe pediades TaxID=84607 RepID=A0A8H4QJK0_9AGAR|nr:hypothetical protein D9613_004122 [Agrocybe pediades]
MPDIFVQSYTHLKDKPNAERALHTLQRVASLVKPIMRKRNWVLPELAEFFPDNPNLLGLNVNMGQKILVRLRPAHSPGSFLPEEDVVGTMLHELTHNVHGPHDDKFYKYLSGLQEEYDALQRSGYAGEGFFSEGKRLGTNVSHNVPPPIARLKALEAAEKRKSTSRVLGSGGRLGGLGRTAGLSPRELAARAAEQRIRDEKSCASGTDALREADKAAKASNSVKTTVIDLTLDDDTPANDHGSGSDSDVVIVEDLHPVKVKNPAAGTSKVASSSKIKAGKAPIARGGGSLQPNRTPSAEERKTMRPSSTTSRAGVSSPTKTATAPGDL